MNILSRFKVSAFLVAGIVCVSMLSSAADTPRSASKTKKTQLAPLPSGPQGPVPQVPLDLVPAVAPQVSYQNGRLTIVAPNSTLSDILRAVRKQTSADVEIPPNANERVITRLGPGSAREVVAQLLNGSRFNYVLLGSASDANVLSRIVLVAKSPENARSGSTPDVPQPPTPEQAADAGAPPASAEADAADPAEAPDDNTAEDGTDTTAADTDQPAPEQPPVKTPQQMLQEMQQRQLQLQQGQQGAQPTAGPAYPGAVPPQNPPQQ
jgi:hypothetical protein